MPAPSSTVSAEVVDGRKSPTTWPRDNRRNRR